MTFRRILLAVAVTAGIMTSCNRTAPISHQDWAPDVKAALNDFIKTYGGNDGKDYVVFDFDNTTSIFDVSLQLMAHQLETMSFNQTPEEFSGYIRSALSGCWDIVSDRIEEIDSDYAALYDKYGPFSYKGLDSAACEVIRNDSLWVDFAGKMGGTYRFLDENDSVENAFIWVMGWMAGMSGDEAYDLSYRSHKIYADKNTSIRSIGDYDWVEGIQVTENLKELWKALDENGIDVWVCSASSVEAVIAAVDAFGMHDWCTGVVAMTFGKDSTGRLTSSYDYETGKAWMAQKDGTWTEGEYASRVETWGDGKVTSIINCIEPLYGGRGPLAGFMDSTGDFNFCTEFSSLKLALCFNRGSRKVTDGGGLIAETALYERDVLGYNLKKANAAGDILYLLQGRDENGLRTLRPSNATMRLGEDSEILLFNDENRAQLEWMAKNRMSVKEIMEKFSVITPADDPSNPLGFDYGFLKEYHGYRSR